MEDLTSKVSKKYLVLMRLMTPFYVIHQRRKMKSSHVEQAISVLKKSEWFNKSQLEKIQMTYSHDLKVGVSKLRHDVVLGS